MVQADSPSHWLPCTTPSTKHTESVVRSTACLRVVLGHMLVAIPKGETFFLFVTGQCPDLPNAHMFDFDSCLIKGPLGAVTKRKDGPFLGQPSPRASGC